MPGNDYLVGNHCILLFRKNKTEYNGYAICLSIVNDITNILLNNSYVFFLIIHMFFSFPQ